MLATTSPFPQFFDADGSPLDDGELFYGSANLNPENNPLIVYWDAAGTQPAAQPVKVMNGYPVRGGTPANIFSALDYSLTVRDRKGRIVYYSPSSVSYSNDLALQQQIAQAVSDLKTLYADPASALNGAGAVGYGSDIAYMAGTIGAKARETKSIFYFMSNAQLQDVMTNTCALDLASVFTAARAWAAGLGRPAAVIFPGFRYKASAFPNWDIKDLALVSIGTPEWICTGAGPIMRRDGSAGFIYGQFIGDFILTGNPGCSVGYLATKTTHSVVGQIRVREVSGTSHQIQ